MPFPFPPPGGYGGLLKNNLNLPSLSPLRGGYGGLLIRYEKRHMETRTANCNQRAHSPGNYAGSDKLYGVTLAWLTAVVLLLLG